MLTRATLMFGASVVDTLSVVLVGITLPIPCTIIVGSTEEVWKNSREMGTGVAAEKQAQHGHVDTIFQHPRCI